MTSSPAVPDKSETDRTLSTGTAVSGDVIGRNVIIGDYNLQITGDGARVTLIDPRHIPRPQRLAGSVHLPGRRPEPFVGREMELAQIRSSAATEVLQVVGPPGIGKSTLLRELSQWTSADLPDGTVLVSLPGLPVDDWLLGVFDCFHERCSLEEPVVRPTPAQVRRGLASVRAVLVLDDLELDSSSTHALLAGLQASKVVYATREPRIADARTLRLQAFAEVESLALADGLRARVWGPTVAVDVAFRRAVLAAAGNPGAIEKVVLGLAAPTPAATDEDLKPAAAALLKWHGSTGARAPLHGRGAMLAALSVASDGGLHSEVMECVRAVEPHLLLDGAFGSWARVLQLHERAALALGDDRQLRWCLHEQGVLALCSENRALAAQRFQSATRLPLAEGDDGASRVTAEALKLVRPRRTPLYALAAAAIVPVLVLGGVQLGAHSVEPVPPSSAGISLVPTTDSSVAPPIANVGGQPGSGGEPGSGGRIQPRGAGGARSAGGATSSGGTPSSGGTVSTGGTPSGTGGAGAPAVRDELRIQAPPRPAVAEEPRPLKSCERQWSYPARAYFTPSSQEPHVGNRRARELASVEWLRDGKVVGRGATFPETPCWTPCDDGTPRNYSITARWKGQQVEQKFKVTNPKLCIRPAN